MFCLYILPLARPAEAKVQMLEKRGEDFIDLKKNVHTNFISISIGQAIETVFPSQVSQNG